MGAWRSYTAAGDDTGLRVDSLLRDRGLYGSRSAAVHAIEQGRVLVNGNAVGKRDLVNDGDVIVYEMDEAAVPTALIGEDIPLDIRYEDDSVIVLSKQAGLVCHPSEDHASGTLVNALIHHCGASHLCNVQGDRDRLGIVHRLDGDTSGLMLAAKTDHAGSALMEAIRIRAVDRRYLCLAHGTISHDTGMIDAPIARHPKERTRMSVRECPQAREAVTTFRVLKRFEPSLHDNGYSLIECKLYTGRTHQIRVHLEYAKHPVVGDPLYRMHAPKHPDADLGLRRQFLHSCHVAFVHPETGEGLEFDDVLPDDLQRVLDDLEARIV